MMNLQRYTNKLKFNEKHKQILYKMQKSDNLIFNILIRFVYDENSDKNDNIKQCIESILNQTLNNYKIFVIIDNKKCFPILNIFNDKINIIFFKTEKREGYQNLYFNRVFDKINGWVLFMDSFNTLRINALLTIFDRVKSDNDFCIWKYKKNNTIIFHKKIRKMELCTIAFHTKNLKNTRFVSCSNGVERFLNSLIKTNKFNFVFIERAIVTNSVQIPLLSLNDLHNKVDIGADGSDKKFTIVMAYCNRKKQLLLTLKQFSKLYKKYNLEIIIIDDCSDDEHTINDLCELFPSLTLKLIKLTNKTWINPVVPFNKGILNISDDTDFVLFQSPEIFHCSDIISHVGGNLNDTNYLTYPVFNSYDYAMNDTVEKLFESNCDDYYDAFISKVDINIADKRTDYYRWKGWLNHKLYNNRKLHFLSAITKKNLDKIGGLCNVMKDGYSYDDNDFLHRISQVCNPMTVDSNKFIGIHLKHDGGTYNLYKNPNYKSLIEKNLTIFKNNMENNIIYCDPEKEYNNPKKTLIVLDRYLKGGLEKHTDILKNGLNADVMVFNESVKNHKKFNDDYLNYDVVLWQHVLNKIPEKNQNQKYIYIFHNQCYWWEEKQKDIMKINDAYIDSYIYVSDSVKQNIEKNIFVPKNSYVIENQLPEMKNDKQEIPGLFVSSGTFTEMKGHLKLIQEFSTLDNSNTLEIYGDIHNKDYFNMIQKHISDNKLDNIKLFEYTDDYINRLKEAEYFCLFSKSEGCSYSMLEAISLNKKIICTKECLTENMLSYKNLSCEFKKYEKSVSGGNVSSYLEIFLIKYCDILDIDHKYNNKICIVSAITGKYDVFKTFNTSNLNCYLYSDLKIKLDNDRFKNIIINVRDYNLNGLRKNNKIYNKKIKNMMISKYYKINHHIIPELKKYNYTIWIDGRTIIHNIILLKFKIYDLFLRDKDINMAIHRHTRWCSMYEDAEYCNNFNNDYTYLYNRYDSENLIGQCLKYYDNGFICNKEYQECGFLIRNNHNKKSKIFFDEWWKENINLTYQDQISFRYLVQNLKINVQYIGNNVYDNHYTKVLSHNNKIINYIPFNFDISNINKSFDLWDTLIGRICLSHLEIFKLIEKRLKIENFYINRIKSEEIVCKNSNNNFTIYDIYDHLYDTINTKLSKKELLNYEFFTEINLSFKIQENCNKIDKDSIIVSDFFYDKDMFSKFLYINKVWVPLEKIFVSNAGKLKGDIWDKIPYSIRSHIGDNKWSDCEHPAYKKHNINSCFFNKDLNEYENYMVTNNFNYLGYIMRSVRLSNPYDKNSDSWILWNFYSNHYLPIIFLKLYSLKLLFNLEKEKLVFMSRDGYFMLHFYRALFPSNDYDYIYISRLSMKDPDEKYIKYVKNKVNNAIVIDLLGSGNSFTSFCKKYEINYKSYVLYFMGRSEEYNIEYFQNKKMYAIFNYFNRYIERLNYATHGSFISFKNNKLITKKFEYDENLYKPIYQIVRLASEHINKLNDILIDYNFDEKTLYNMLFRYLGPPDFISIPRCLSFNNEILNVLDKIGHEDLHENNNIVELDIKSNYFLDLDEYLVN